MRAPTSRASAPSEPPPEFGPGALFKMSEAHTARHGKQAAGRYGNNVSDRLTVGVEILQGRAGQGRCIEPVGERSGVQGLDDLVFEDQAGRTAP